MHLECKGLRKTWCKVQLWQSSKKAVATHTSRCLAYHRSEAVQVHESSEHRMATACSHLLIRVRARHKPVFPSHRTDSRWITHSSGQALEKGEKQVNCSNRRAGDTQVPCSASFQNHGVTTTGRDTRKWKLSCLEQVQLV